MNILLTSDDQCCDKPSEGLQLESSCPTRDPTRAIVRETKGDDPDISAILADDALDLVPRVAVPIVAPMRPQRARQAPKRLLLEEVVEAPKGKRRVPKHKVVCDVQGL